MISRSQGKKEKGRGLMQVLQLTGRMIRWRRSIISRGERRCIWCWRFEGDSELASGWTYDGRFLPESRVEDGVTITTLIVRRAMGVEDHYEDMKTTVDKGGSNSSN